MKIPYGWVREFVDVKLSAQDAADRLVNAGVEVASVTPLLPEGLRGVIVGRTRAPGSGRPSRPPARRCQASVP